VWEWRPAATRIEHSEARSDLQVGMHRSMKQRH
jgi:hypothetical protein